MIDERVHAHAPVFPDGELIGKKAGKQPSQLFRYNKFVFTPRISSEHPGEFSLFL